MGIDVAGAAGKADEGFIDHFGGTFAMTKGLIQEFGTSRVLDTPISETGFVGAGVGAAAEFPVRGPLSAALRARSTDAAAQPARV